MLESYKTVRGSRSAQKRWCLGDESSKSWAALGASDGRGACRAHTQCPFVRELSFARAAGTGRRDDRRGRLDKLEMKV